MKFTVNNEQVGDGTAGPLQTWIKEWVAARYPDLGIEYWSDNQNAPHAYKAFSPLPRRIHHAGAHVYQGRSEGYILEVLLASSEDGIRCLTWAKVFDTPDTLWAVARDLAAAVEQICIDRAVPPLTREAPGENVTAYAVVQAGGSSEEIYLHVSLTNEDAQDFRRDCAKGAYQTSAVVEIPAPVARQGEAVYAVMEELLQASLAMDYPDDYEDEDEDEDEDGRATQESHAC